jgi:hypothetical protein
MSCHQLCSYCDEAIGASDPVVAISNGVLHHECAVRMFAGSAAHQLGDCSCCGGTRHDPPDLSKRAAAQLAADAFAFIRDVPAVEAAPFNPEDHPRVAPTELKFGQVYALQSPYNVVTMNYLGMMHGLHRFGMPRIGMDVYFAEQDGALADGEGTRIVPRVYRGEL